ncbi:MAG: hypothetical protein KF810_02910 [Rhizobiaceae bacterium]|nr:hypothetical protein [Rhizobiaceae bacterium]
MSITVTCTIRPPLSPAERALLLFEAWEAMPADRGGKNGPRGRAWQAFVGAKNVALDRRRP